MELRQALKEQYYGAIGMLAECIEKCPDDVWVDGAPGRATWQIAWHAAYYTHLYMLQTADEFNRSASEWPASVRAALGVSDSQGPTNVEPHGLPEDAAALSQRDLLDYIGYVRAIVDPTVERLDLDRADTGFHWYPNMTKLSHEMMNLRHCQGHVGQLSELLMAKGIDTEWIARAGEGWSW